MGEYICLQHVYKRYKMGEVTITAANDVCFGVEKGEFAVVVGASGAGKTTVLNMLGGIDSADEGNIIVDGKNVSKLNNRELITYRRRDIGFVFQFYNLIPNLTAMENVELATQISENPMDVMKALNSVGLSDRVDNFPSQLSGGEQQRVSIARAIAKNPDILLCDEPTGALDSETGCMVLSELQKLCRSEGKTVLVVTHNANIARAADRVIHIRSGEIKSIECCDDPCSVEEVEW